MGIHFCFLEVNAFYSSAFGCIIGYLLCLRNQRVDFRIGCHQLNLICFSSKRGIQIIYVFHQSAGSITNRSFKNCYFPLYVHYASFQCCNRSLLRFLCQFGVHIRLCIDIYRIGFQSQFCLRSYRINFLFNISCITSYIGSVCRDLLPLSRCRILQSIDIVLVRSDVGSFSVTAQLSSYI